MISFIFLFRIIDVVLPDPSIFVWIATSTADAVNPNDIKTLLANGLSTFPIKDSPCFSNGPKSQPKNPHDCHILCNWVFDNFILADELLAKALRTFETSLLLNNSLPGKFISSLESPTTFHEILKVNSVRFFNPDFNLLSWELDSFTLKCYIESFYIDIILKFIK